MYEKMHYQLFINTASFGLALTTNLALANILFRWTNIVVNFVECTNILWNFSLLIVYICIINNF